MKRFANRMIDTASVMIGAIIAALTLAAAASAQQVLVMDEQRILSESQVGQHISSELERIGAEIQQELQAAGEPIRQENEALNAETAALSQEAIQQRPDLIQRIQQLQQDAQVFEQTRRRRQQELVATERAAMQPVMQTLQTILQEIVQERGAAVLLDRSQVVYASDTIDISQTAIERLNQRIQTTPVNRVRLPEQGQGQQQQPQQ